MPCRKAQADREGSLSEVYDADLLLSLRLVRRKNPPPAGAVEVTPLDPPDFLRPAAGLPADGDQVSKLLSLRESDHPSVRRVVDYVLALAGRRLLHERDRRLVEPALLDRPVETPLDGLKPPALHPGVPVGVRIDPLLEVVRAEVAGEKPLVVQGCQE